MGTLVRAPSRSRPCSRLSRRAPPYAQAPHLLVPRQLQAGLPQLLPLRRHLRIQVARPGGEPLLPPFGRAAVGSHERVLRVAAPARRDVRMEEKRKRVKRQCAAHGRASQGRSCVAPQDSQPILQGCAGLRFEPSSPGVKHLQRLLPQPHRQHVVVALWQGCSAAGG